jgi:hypothetical protein
MGQKAREIMMKDEQEQHGEYVKMGEVYLISEETVEKATDFTVVKTTRRSATRVK